MNQAWTSHSPTTNQPLTIIKQHQRTIIDHFNQLFINTSQLLILAIITESSDKSTISLTSDILNAHHPACPDLFSTQIWRQALPPWITMVTHHSALIGSQNWGPHSDHPIWTIWILITEITQSFLGVRLTSLPVMVTLVSGVPSGQLNGLSLEAVSNRCRPCSP